LVFKTKRTLSTLRWIDPAGGKVQAERVGERGLRNLGVPGRLDALLLELGEVRLDGERPGLRRHSGFKHRSRAVAVRSSRFHRLFGDRQPFLCNDGAEIRAHDAEQDVALVAAALLLGELLPQLRRALRRWLREQEPAD